MGAVALAVSASGCAAPLMVPAAAAAQAAGSGYSFIKGNTLTQALPATPEEVSRTFDEVVGEFSLTVVDDESEHDGESLVSRVVRLADDDENLGTVRIERMTETLTFTESTAKLFGKRAPMVLLMQRVRARLSGVEADAIPDPDEG